MLKVLERPDIPLNTNGSENDIRCQVTKRKISGGTRSDLGRDCRDAFLGLLKPCAKQGRTTVHDAADENQSARGSHRCASRRTALA